MNYFNSQPQISPKIDSNVEFAPNICVAGKSGLLELTLCSTFSPSKLPTNTHHVTGSIIGAISTIAGLGNQDKAWMLRKIVTVGRRMKFL